MKRLVFDIETNGFLTELDRIHCIAAKDPDTNETFSFPANHVHEGIELLSKADVLVAHNGQRFDIPAIRKVFKSFVPPKLLDTLLLSRLYHPDIKREMDFGLHQQKKIPGNLLGSHSLEAWGHRLGNFKGDFKGPWDQWTLEMQTYCEQDVEVTVDLFRRFEKMGWPQHCVELEHELAAIINAQEDHGFLFDQPAAIKLYADLSARRNDIALQLKQAFGTWEEYTTIVPKANNSKLGYVKGVPFRKAKVIEFNPSSRPHIIKRLMAKYDWQPETWTDSGDPEIDEDVLSRMPYPEAKLLAEHFLLDKRLGQLADGKQGWMRVVRTDSRIHGRIVTNGTPTGRARHMDPNMSQVPSCSKPYGKEFRSLFTVPAGHKLVGIDVSGLELRMLAHYLAKYDGGDFSRIVVDGDIHTENWKAAPNLITSRTMAKPVIYAMIYGAQDPKLGEIVGKGRAAGTELRKALYGRYKGLDTITKAAQHAAKTRGYLIGLDGRHMPIRSQHAALNTLLQGAGGVLCKQWIVDAHRAFRSAGLNVHQVAWSHDEIQIECQADIAEEVGRVAVGAIQTAAERFNVRCPLTGEYKIGNNWAETH